MIARAFNTFLLYVIDNCYIKNKFFIFNTSFMLFESIKEMHHLEILMIKKKIKVHSFLSPC